LFEVGFPVTLHVCSSPVNSRRQRAAISQSYLSSCAPSIKQYLLFCYSSDAFCQGSVW